MAAGRLKKPGWKILGGTALAGLVWFGFVPLLKRMEFFRVTGVEVRGLQNLRAEAVVKVLPVRRTMSIFDDLTPLRAAAESIPGLAQVSVGRRLPGTVILQVTEEAPVALVMRQSRLQLVSESGTVLSFDPTVAAPDLPLVRQPDSSVTRLLARLRDVDATLFADVSAAWRSGDDVVLQVNGHRYWFRPDASAEVIQAVTAVAQDLARKGKRWAELDGRFAGQVVVRWAAA